ncbi:MAG: VOC family protein [Spirochaetaceae bacterium]|nr:VOC family protein [Spirochaetaceae bacterium]MDT8298622.1 VOC family protein [Spirochaetaceae bacterium]
MNKHPNFTFAHAGLNVDDLDAASDWYTKHLGLSVARSVPGNMTFLADPTGRVIIEFYANKSAPVLDFHRTHFLSLHLAFLVDDPEAAAERLVAAGATIAEAFKVTDAGDRMVMLQDPFGISVQLISRAEPMF